MENVHSQGGANMENGKRVRVLMQLRPLTKTDNEKNFGFTHQIGAAEITFESEIIFDVGDEISCSFILPSPRLFQVNAGIKVTKTTVDDKTSQLRIYEAKIISAEQLDIHELLNFVGNRNDPASPTATDDDTLKTHLYPQGTDKPAATLIEKLTSRLMEQDFAEYMAKRVIEEFKQDIHNRKTRSIHWIQHIEGRKAIYWEHDFSELLKDTFIAMELPSSLCLPSNKDRFEHLVKVHFDNEPSIFDVFVSIKIDSDHRHRFPVIQFIVNMRIILNDN